MYKTRAVCVLAGMVVFVGLGVCEGVCVAVFAGFEAVGEDALGVLLGVGEGPDVGVASVFS